MLISLFLLYSTSGIRRRNFVRPYLAADRICYEKVKIDPSLKSLKDILNFYKVPSQIFLKDNPRLVGMKNITKGLIIKLRTPCQPLAMDAPEFKDTCISQNGSAFLSLCATSHVTSRPEHCKLALNISIRMGYVSRKCDILNWDSLAVKIFGAKSFRKNIQFPTNNMEIINGYVIDGKMHYVLMEHCEEYVKFDPLPGTVEIPVKLEPVDRKIVEFVGDRYYCRKYQ